MPFIYLSRTLLLLKGQSKSGEKLHLALLVKTLHLLKTLILGEAIKAWVAASPPGKPFRTSLEIKKGTLHLLKTLTKVKAWGQSFNLAIFHL